MGSTRNRSRLHKLWLAGTEIGRPSASALEHQKLVFQEEILGDNRLAPARSKQRRHSHH